MDTVRVAVRFRPFIPQEIQQGSVGCVELQSHLGTVSITSPDGWKETKTYSFDHVFDQTTTQECVFNELGKPIVDAAMHGYKTCIFAYGQTGSGKTHSMTGSDADPGISLRVFQEVFRIVRLKNKVSPETSYHISISYCELYNEVLRDLLDPDRFVGDKGLEIRENQELGIYVKGLSHWDVQCPEDMLKLKTKGDALRKICEHNLNEKSSRSHCIFSIDIRTMVPAELEGAIGSCTGKINLVDLAGSERVTKTGASNATMIKDASLINKSLSNLGNVIKKLSLQTDEHIPYRSSKLSRLLQDSLGGNSKTVMLATASPAACNYEETLQTLSYAQRAKKIKNRAKPSGPPEPTTMNAAFAKKKQLESYIADLSRRLRARDMPSDEAAAVRSELAVKTNECAELTKKISEQWSEARQLWESKISSKTEQRERIDNLRKFTLPNMTCADVFSQVLDDAWNHDAVVEEARTLEISLKNYRQNFEQTRRSCFTSLSKSIREMKRLIISSGSEFQKGTVVSIGKNLQEAESAAEKMSDYRSCALGVVSNLQTLISKIMGDEILKISPDLDRSVGSVNASLLNERHERMEDLDYLKTRLDAMGKTLKEASTHISFTKDDAATIIAFCQYLSGHLSSSSTLTTDGEELMSSVKRARDAAENIAKSAAAADTGSMMSAQVQCFQSLQAILQVFVNNEVEIASFADHSQEKTAIETTISVDSTLPDTSCDKHSSIITDNSNNNNNNSQEEHPPDNDESSMDLRIFRLEEKLVDYEAQVQLQKKHRMILEKDMLRLKGEIASKAAAIAGYEKEKMDMTKENKKLQNLVAGIGNEKKTVVKVFSEMQTQMMGTLDVLTKEIMKISNENAQHQGHIEQLKKAITENAEKFHAAKCNWAVVESQLHLTLKDAVSKLSDFEIEKKEESDRFAKEMAAMKEDKNTAVAESNESTKRLNSLVGALSEERLRREKGEAESAEKQKELESQLKISNEKCVELSSEVKKLSETLANRQISYDEKIKVLEQETSSYKKVIQNLENKLVVQEKKHNDSVCKLEERLEKYRQDLKASMQSVSAQRELVASLTDDNGNLNLKIEKLHLTHQKQITALQSAIDDHEKENAEMSEQLEKLQNERLVEQAERESEKSDVEKQQLTIESLRAQLLEAQAKCMDLRTEAALAHATLQKQQSNAATSQARANQLAEEMQKMKDIQKPDYSFGLHNHSMLMNNNNNNNNNNNSDFMDLHSSSGFLPPTPTVPVNNNNNNNNNTTLARDQEENEDFGELSEMDSRIATTDSPMRSLSCSMIQDEEIVPKDECTVPQPKFVGSTSTSSSYMTSPSILTTSMLTPPPPPQQQQQQPCNLSFSSFLTSPTTQKESSFVPKAQPLKSCLKQTLQQQQQEPSFPLPLPPKNNSNMDSENVDPRLFSRAINAIPLSQKSKNKVIKFQCEPNECEKSIMSSMASSNKQMTSTPQSRGMPLKPVNWNTLYQKSVSAADVSKHLDQIESAALNVIETISHSNKQSFSRPPLPN